VAEEDERRQWKTCLKEISLFQEYPPAKATFERAFLALVSALAQSGQIGRAKRFIVDMVAARLHDQDLADVWDVPNPMGTLAFVLARDGRGDPEARLLWESGPGTIFGCTYVGVYSDQQLIGQCECSRARNCGPILARLQSIYFSILHNAADPLVRRSRASLPAHRQFWLSPARRVRPQSEESGLPPRATYLTDRNPFSPATHSFGLAWPGSAGENALMAPRKTVEC